MNKSLQNFQNVKMYKMIHVLKNQNLILKPNYSLGDKLEIGDQCDWFWKQQINSRNLSSYGIHPRWGQSDGKVLSWNIKGVLQEFGCSRPPKPCNWKRTNTGYKSTHFFGNKSANTRRIYSGGVSLYYRQYLTDEIKVVDQHLCGIFWITILSDGFVFS